MDIERYYVNSSKEIIFEPVLEVKANCCLAGKKKRYFMQSKDKSNGKCGSAVAVTQWVGPGMSHIQRSVQAAGIWVWTCRSHRILKEILSAFIHSSSPAPYFLKKLPFSDLRSLSPHPLPPVLTVPFSPFPLTPYDCSFCSSGSFSPET